MQDFSVSTVLASNAASQAAIASYLGGTQLFDSHLSKCWKAQLARCQGQPRAELQEEDSVLPDCSRMSLGRGLHPTGHRDALPPWHHFPAPWALCLAWAPIWDQMRLKKWLPNCLDASEENTQLQKTILIFLAWETKIKDSKQQSVGRRSHKVILQGAGE